MAPKCKTKTTKCVILKCYTPFRLPRITETYSTQNTCPRWTDWEHSAKEWPLNWPFNLGDSQNGATPRGCHWEAIFQVYSQQKHGHCATICTWVYVSRQLGKLLIDWDIPCKRKKKGFIRNVTLLYMLKSFSLKTNIRNKFPACSQPIEFVDHNPQCNIKIAFLWQPLGGALYSKQPVLCLIPTMQMQHQHFSAQNV